MSELYCKFQITASNTVEVAGTRTVLQGLYCKFHISASNTVGGVVETRTFYKVGWMDGKMEVCMDKGKTICPSPLHGGSINKKKRMVVQGQLVAPPPPFCLRQCEELIY